jgi:hypothetical protein
VQEEDAKGFLRQILGEERPTSASLDAAAVVSVEGAGAGGSSTTASSSAAADDREDVIKQVVRVSASPHCTMCITGLPKLPTALLRPPVLPDDTGACAWMRDRWWAATLAT